MRAVASIVICCVILLSSGCTVWEKETTNRGGYLDYVIDQNWLKADSKRMRALRAFAIQVSLARIASVSAKNDSDRQLLAIRIGAATKQFVPVYDCAVNINPLNVPGAENDPCFYFDSAMVQYTTSLFDLAMAALPIDDAKNLITMVSASGTTPVAFVSLFNALIVIGRDALTYGRVVGALYRDTIELEVQLWLATPPIDNRPPPYRVTEADVAPLRAIYEAGNDNMPAWISAMQALRDRGLEPQPNPKFFLELGGLMKYICDLVTKDPTASATCKANLPTTMPPPAAVLASAPTAPLVHVSTPAPPPGPPKPAPAPSPGPPSPAPANTGLQPGTDQERQLLHLYLQVGANKFDPTRAQSLNSLLTQSDVAAEITRDQGTGSAAPLPIIVDAKAYASARVLIVKAACQKQLFQPLGGQLAAACGS